MSQVLQKGLLRGCAEGLDPQCSGVGLFLGHLRLPVLLHIFYQLIEVVLPLPPMEPCQIPLVGNHDELVPGSGYGYVDQLLVVFQPFIGSPLRLIRKSRGE